MSPNCQIHALGAYVPETVLSNADLTEFVETSDEWIVERTGIHQRRRLGDREEASTLGLRASRAALEQCGMSPRNLTHVLVATCTPDHLSPSVACMIAGELDAGPVMALDLGAACTGYIYGLSVCRSILCSDPESEILFVCTEALTRRLNWRDRSTCVLFGDAATACLLNSRAENSLFDVRDVLCQSDGKQKDLIVVGGGTSCRYQEGSPVDGGFFITMQGRETYKHAVRHMVRVCETLLERNSLTMNDISLLVPHQANLRIIEAVGSRLHIDSDRVFTNLALYGNTSAASIPLALAEARSEGRISSGDRVLVTAFGAGLTWGAALLQF